MRTAPLVATLLVGANASFTPAQITEVMDGLIGSALHYEKLDGYKACYLDDNVKPVNEIVQGIQDFETAVKAKDVVGLKKAADELQTGFKAILTGEKDCVAKTQDPARLAKIETYMKQYESMSALQSHVEVDLAWYSISIAEEISDAKKQMLAGNYTAYGADYGKLLDQVLIGTTRFSAEQKLGAIKAVTTKEVAQVIEGILLGAIKAEGLNNIQDCIKDGETVFSDVKDGIALIEKKDARDVLAGLEKIGAGVVEIKTALSDCEGIVADFAKLGEMAAVFSNPWSFAYHIGKDLVVNGVQIYHETTDAVTQYHSGNMEAMGEDIGEALAKLLLGGAVETQADFRVQQATNFKNLNLF